MKTLQNYKIEPQGLNEAILHKAVELGYNDNKTRIMLRSKYLFLFEDGNLMYGNTKDKFNEEPCQEISAHDFLRLNWTPKVGEEVATVFPIENTRYGIIEDIEIKDFSIKFSNGENEWYNIEWVIPLYPRKKQLRFKTEQEFIEEFGEGWRDEITPNWCYGMNRLFGQPVNKDKPTGSRWMIDTYVFSDSMLTDKPLPEQKQEKPDAYIVDDHNIVARLAGVNHKLRYLSVNYMLEKLHEYHIMDPEAYNGKYPDKLMFKNWEVVHDSPRIHIGCITTTEFILKKFLQETQRASDKEMDSVTLLELREFLTDNKKTLDL